MNMKKLLKREEYTVVWLCALPLSEAVAAWKMLDEEHEELPQDNNDENTYTYGSIKGHNVVIACMPPGQPGKVSASRMVQSLPISFPNLKIQLFVGIGGGIPCDPPTKDATKDIHLGDVVVGWSDETGAPAVVQHDLIRSTGQAKERLSVMDKPNRLMLNALGRMLTDRVRGKDFFPSHLERFAQANLKGFEHPGCDKDTLYQSVYEHVGPATCEDCDSTKVVERKSRQNPVFHQGTIASGDTVVKDPQLRDEIGRQCYGAKCVEMEAAGVIDQTHCLVIRGIADYADSHKKEIWQPYAAATAAAFARELLLTIQPSIVAQMEHVQMQMNGMVESEKQYRILKWLCPLEFAPKLSDMLDRRQEGTGAWFLKSQPFRAWLEGSIRTMWCPGMPGAGKTILASTIIEYLRHIHKDNSDIAIGWVYCIYKERGQTALNFLANLLRQFIQQKGSLSPELLKLYENHCPYNTRPLTSEVSRFLHSYIQTFSKVYIVIDALDECPETERTRDTFLSELKNLPSNAYLLVTSRPNSLVESSFAEAERLEISAHEDDLRAHLADRIANEPLLSKHVTVHPSLRDTIISKVIEKARGMFLLAELHIDSLSAEPSVGRLRKALDILPEKVVDTYDQAMERIQSQKRSKVDLANRILSWVVFAQRQMMIEELRCALAVEPGDSELNEEALPYREYLLSVCGGLITISADTEIVRFIHYTTQEYFERTLHPQFSSSQTYLASICITYLSFSTFASGNCERVVGGSKSFDLDVFYRRRLKENALLKYASAYWGDHVRESGNHDSTLHTTVRKFLIREANVTCSIRSAKYEDPKLRFDKSWYKDRNVFYLHLGSRLGLKWLVEECLEQGASVDAQDSKGRTPLHFAATGGHIGVVKSLLENRADLEARGEWGFNAMQQAAAAGHDPVTLLLLRTKASIFSINDLIRTVIGGNLEVLRAILEIAKNERERAFIIGRALKRAALWPENEACVRLLLEEGKDVDVNMMQSDLDEAAISAVKSDSTKVLQLLLEHGAHFNNMTRHLETESTNSILTALHRVVSFYGTGTPTPAVRFLLDDGADIEAVYEGNRPIHTYLSSIHHDGAHEAFGLLLERGADANAYGSNMATPLITVALKGFVTLARKLLDFGADPRKKDGEFGRSAIEWAVLKGDLPMVQLLLTSQRQNESSKGLLALAQLLLEFSQ